MNNSAKFWDKIAHRYSERPVTDEVAYQRKLQITREYLRGEMQVFEFGCGTGSTAITHAPYVKHVHAIDVSSKMIEIARAKADAGKLENVTFEQASIEEIGVPDEYSDVVLGLSILHLLENKEQTIARVYKMLKPGGIFVTSTACIGDTMKFIKYVAPIGKFIGLMPLVEVFTREELVEALTGANFTIEYQWQPGRGESVFIVAKKPE